MVAGSREESVESLLASHEAPPPLLSRHPYERANREIRNVCYCGRAAGDRIHFVRRCEYSSRLSALGDVSLCAECKQPMEFGRPPWARYCHRKECQAQRAREFTARNNRRRAESRAVLRSR